MAGRVLVIDDESTVRHVVARLVKRAGFEVTEAENGRDAQAKLREEAFDVALVDLAMPEMDGIALLDWMRKSMPDVIPIVLSGTSNVADAIKAVQHGAFDILSKPVESPEIFGQYIARALDHKWLRDRNAELVDELQRKNTELANRLRQLELAHSALQSQAVATQVELRRAMRVQHALLPKTLPFSDRLSLSILFHPAAKVGGDIYDTLQLDDRHLGVYIADSAGHGVGSAMLTVFLKLAMRPLAEASEGYRMVEPGAVLRALNHMVFEEAFGFDMFISVTYLVLDVDTLEVRYANAGHPPLLIRRANGTVEPVRLPAPALGLDPNVQYSDGEFRLAKDDVLVLYTDGVLDARTSTGASFGATRLRQVLAASEPTADAITQTLDRELSISRPATEFPDDVTVLALGIAPQPNPYAPPESPVDAKLREVPAVGEVEVRTASDNGCLFITVTGPGTWREGQRVLDLVDKAAETGESSIILDFAHCRHLDSTFYGILHRLVLRFDDDADRRIEIQNVPPALLREISDLGLTSVLMHFRSRPAPLPDEMRPLDASKPEDAQMGHLLLHAHEALVEADPRNADRFAAVLEVLRERAHRPAPPS
ncbi:MAG TPA: SpoIIE family protein phosphatase [Candidatus Hydrogenedentes bacterium]|nr:SpoIIE family protein phosphatase [Candidatus Hydrogenedentota bacterium]HPG68488.1 SpoIIE family protein phosphatase [Candidatus Hydrogenedentota bacterium]